MASHQPKEMKLFNKYYFKLCHTLTDIDDLLPYFVQENIIKIDELEEIKFPSTKKDKVQKLLVHISGPLEAGNTKVFHTMLRIMEEHGHDATQQLADQIRRSLPTAIDDKRSYAEHYSK